MSTLIPGDTQLFARVLSHDLAALIRSARQLSAYAREDVIRDDADSAMHALGMLDLRLANVDRFVSELIRFYRAGERVPKVEPFSIVEVIQSLFKSLCPQSQSQLRLTCSRNMMIADVELVQGSLREVIKNAVMHHDTPEEIQLDIQVVQDDEGFVLISVEDNGPGVPAGWIGRITQPFVKTGSRAGSAGLGLAICDREIRAAGGTMTVRRGANRGVCVQLCIPGGLEAAAANPGRPTIQPIDSGDEKPHLKIV